jgi:hypothetical protein
MIKLRCKPDQRCLVIGDVRSCECNVGATVTVVEVIPPPGPMRPAWVFKDASRPLKMVDLDRHGHPVPGTESYATATYNGGSDALPLIFDHHLMPLQGDGTGDGESTDTDIFDSEAFDTHALAAAVENHRARAAQRPISDAERTA